MPKKTHNPIRDAVGSVLCIKDIEMLARECGAVKRQRKIDFVVLVGVIVCGFSTGAERSLAAMRRVYEQVTGQTLAPSGFYSRFTCELVQVLKRLVERAIQQVQQQKPRLQLSLARFAAVLVADGSLIQLHRSLAKRYPSVFPNKVGAAAKIHVVIDVVGRSVRRLQLAAGKRHDSKLLKVGSWVAGSLLVFDLAYRSGLIFSQVTKHGGYFLSRTKKTDNLVVLDAPWCGRRFSEVALEKDGEFIDVKALVPWRRNEKSRWQRLEVRLVGQWHPVELRHLFYLTNAPQEMLATDSVGPVYTARWEVELFFRELKLTHRVEELPTRKRFVAEALIYAAVLSLLLSRKLHSLVCCARQTFAPERWARIFATFALDILRCSFAPPTRRSDTTRLIRVLRHEAPDPNRKRLKLLERVARGRFAAAAN